MSAKKIIAICQSGGEFQTEKDGSMSYSGGEAYAVDLDTESKVLDFKQDLAETFGYSVDNMLIKYFLPGNRKTLIMISKDKDLKRMINFFVDADQVDVFVVSRDGGREAPNVSNPPASRSSRTTVSEAVNVSSLVVTSHTDNHPDTNEIDSLDIVIDSPSSPELLTLGLNSKKQQKGATQWENTITGVEQRFSSFAEFREALHKFSIAHGFRYKYKKSDSHRVSVKCKAVDCPWRIYVSRLPTTHLIRIKKMHPEHTCTGVAAKAGYRATKGWVGNIIKEKLKNSPNYKPKDIVADIKREYGVEMNYSQAWRAKGIAKELLQGSYKEAYSQLPFFCHKIMETNPGSLATVVTKEYSSFHRFFVAFHASISGFQNGCRPLIFLDDIPLDTKYPGTLLIATAADGDDGVFPLAFSIVVDDETDDDDDNWFWFLSQLKTAVAPISQPITFVANFNKGLKDSIVNVFGGECFHAYCLKYICEKLNNDLMGRFSHEARRLLVQDLYAAASAPKLEVFEQHAQDIKAILPEAYDWVINSEPLHWANVFFDGARYNHMTSNFGKLFYDWVSDVVELPITHMIDVLRGKLMELIYTRRVDSNRWTTMLTLSMEEKVRAEASKAQSFQVLPSETSVFEVHGESAQTVDIGQWDCSCRVWQLTGLPCCHAIAVVECIGGSVYDYCSRYFMAESYRKTYAESIYPIPDIEGSLDGEDISDLIVKPPPLKRAPGKPGKRAKLKQAGSLELIRRQMQCSKCKGLGHNKKTCKEVEMHEASSTPEVLAIEMG